MDTFEVDLTTLTYGGDALGRLPDGRVVFVPFALPGERVRVCLVEEKRGHARAELQEVLQPAPGRILPLCLHFGVCGGCQYQHIPYEDQLQIKAEILKEQLARIGGLSGAPVLPTVPSNAPYYYRNHIQFHLTPEGKLGYHMFRSEQEFAVQECHLHEADINQVWPQLDFESIPGLERIGLRLGVDEDVQLILESSDNQAPELSVEEISLSAVHLSPAGALVLAGSEYVIIEVLGRPFRVSAGSFFQINTAMAGVMVEHLLDNLARFTHLTSRTLALDVYCGVGLFSAFLAPQVGRLVGIESSASAAEDFVINLDEFDNVELYEDRAEDALPQLDFLPELIIVDPPRAGIDRGALDAILKLRPTVLAYISCDPATLARDAKRLITGGYRLAQITPFDLFPQTYHIESMSFWTPG
jgi:23S rRNA (uracil1939-C5)-methyltransferase